MDRRGTKPIRCFPFNGDRIEWTTLLFEGFFLSHYLNSEFIFHEAMNYLLSRYQNYGLNFFHLITLLPSNLLLVQILFHTLISKHFMFKTITMIKYFINN